MILNRFVERYIMRPKRLRKAIFEVVHEHDELLKALAEYEKEGPAALMWTEGDRWYGWTYNRELKRYYFDDIGHESIMALWQHQWAKEKSVEFTQDELW